MTVTPFLRKRLAELPPTGNDRRLADAQDRLAELVRAELAAGSQGAVGVQLDIAGGSIRRVRKVIDLAERAGDE